MVNMKKATKKVTQVVEEEIEKKEEQEEEDNATFGSLGVCKALCDACDALNYKRPTQIQKETLPYALEGRDIIGLAQTGSGKTASFAIPILQSLLETPRGLYACVVAPTRELAFQISEQFEALGSAIGVKTVVLVGGMDPMQQALVLGKKPHIIVGTPGRIVYHLENTKGFSLKFIKYLVLDEADRLLNMDFEEEIDQILKFAPKERNTYLYSATMTTKVVKLQRASLSNPVKIEVCDKYSTVETLRQHYIFIPAKYKDCYLAYILNEFAGNSIIVFTTTCNTAIRLSLLLRNLGFPAIPLTGKMSQTKRLSSLNKFKAGENQILIATDVASRGLDIPSVDVVLNFDVSTHTKEYVHRVGRTARAGRSGRSITFVTQYNVDLFQRIETLIGKKMDLYLTEEETVLVMLERVSEAQRFAQKEMKELGESTGKRKLDQVDGDGFDDDETSSSVRVKRRKNKKGGRKGDRK